jgi:hypothetical protein
MLKKFLRMGGMRLTVLVEGCEIEDRNKGRMPCIQTEGWE